MNHKRIAVISYYSCPLNDEKKEETGGRQIYTLEISRELAKKEYKIDIFTRVIDKTTSKIVNVIPNLRVIHLQAGEQKDIQRRELTKYIPEFLENFYKLLKQEGIFYDLINCHYYLSGLVGLEIKKKLNIPFFVTFHTLSLMKNLVARSVEEKEDIDRIQAEFLLIKTADKIIATSDMDAQYIHSLYNCPLKKIDVLIPGIDLSLFKPADKSAAKIAIKANAGQKIILFVGRIVPLKGIDVLLYALKILIEKESQLNICLWIVGEGSDELKQLEELVKLLNLAKFVKFVGQKKQEELLFYYNASEVVIMPSIYESFGLIALEAMACGIPVIITNTTGVSGLFKKEHNLITSASNPILLAEKIKKLLTDKKGYTKLREGLLNKVQNLTWENAANNFIQVLNK